MKVMIDTNIIISAALSPNGNAAKAFMKAVLPPYEPVVCDYIVDELHRFFQKFSENAATRSGSDVYTYGRHSIRTTRRNEKDRPCVPTDQHRFYKGHRTF